MDEKFDTITQKIEERICNSLLKPSIEKLENSLKSNLGEVKIYLNNITKKIKSKSKAKSKSKSRKVLKNGHTKNDKVLDLVEILNDKLAKKEKLIHMIEKENNAKELSKYKKSYNLSINSFSENLSDL